MEQCEPSAEELRTLAKDFEVAGNFERAAHCHGRALELAPDNAEILFDLAPALHNLKDYERARGFYERAIALKPSDASLYNDLGILCRDEGDFERAFQMFCAAAQRDPKNAVVASNLAGSLLERGQLADARALYEKAVTLAPTNGQYLYQQAEVTPFVANDTRLSAMLDLLKDEDALGIDDKIGLHFALGKTFADTRQHAAAFSHFELGNALKRSSIRYDEALAFEQINEIAESFSRPVFDDVRRYGKPDETPVFVVGMLRSGSTLVKQILASHPGVAAAGEAPHFANALRSVLGDADRNVQQVRDLAGGVSGGKVQDIADTYLASLRRYAPGAVRIIDKDLTNFRFLGLIRAVFPAARIIHISRNALDTCWSCFSKLFAESQPFTYEQGELGRYYRAYTQVMDRWREMLPPDSVLEVRYEDLIENFESTCRQLVAFCGLPWDARCLEFHRREGLVRTSSAVQVRQPLFRNGIGRSAPYRPHLAKLAEALA